MADLSLLREDARLERERSDRLFADYEGEGWIDERDKRLREIVYAIPALLDIAEAAAALASEHRLDEYKDTFSTTLVAALASLRGASE